MILNLENAKPIAEGGERFIFIHPENDDWLVKVWHERFFRKEVKRIPLVLKFLRLKKYWSLSYELTEYLALRENDEAPLKHLQQIIGFIDTNYGLGMIVKSIKNKAGELAPTVGDLISQKSFNDDHRAALDRFYTWMENSNIIVRDFTLNNLVWDEYSNEFIIIDGTGSKPGISLRTFSKRYNKRANINRINKFKTRVEKAIQKAG
jgi:hypothetical protein